MNVYDLNFINILHEALRGLQDVGERQQPRYGPFRVAKNGKVNELPNFFWCYLSRSLFSLGKID